MKVAVKSWRWIGFDSCRIRFGEGSSTLSILRFPWEATTWYEEEKYADEEGTAVPGKTNGTTEDALILTESLCSTTNIRSPKPWGSKHGFTQYFRFINVDIFFYKFDVSTTVLLICKHKGVQSIIFGVSIKFCDESGQALLSFAIYFS